MNIQILTQTCSKVKSVFTKCLMKTLSVTITSLALLIGFVGSSSANEEDEFTVSMTSGDETYYSDSGYITHTAEIETSHVFAEVDWYVNGVWQTTSKGDGEKKTASFTKGFSGNGYGRSYEIKAVAYSEGGETDSDSHRIRVKKMSLVIVGDRRTIMDMRKTPSVNGVAQPPLQSSLSVSITSPVIR